MLVTALVGETDKAVPRPTSFVEAAMANLLAVLGVQVFPDATQFVLHLLLQSFLVLPLQPRFAQTTEQNERFGDICTSRRHRYIRSNYFLIYDYNFYLIKNKLSLTIQSYSK